MAAGTILSRLTGYGRVAALLMAFGYGRMNDTYNLANTVPNIVYELVVGGVLGATLVTAFSGWLEEGDDERAWRRISAVVTFAVVTSLVLAVLTALFAPHVIRLYTLANQTSTSADQRAVGSALLRWFAPQIACLGLITVATALLHVRRRFAAPMWVPILNNVVVIAAIVVAGRVARAPTLEAARGDLGLLAVLGAGTTVGYVVNALALVPSLRRAGVRVRPVWAPRDEAVRHVGRLAGWTLGFVVANQVALFVVIFIANRTAGGVTAYQSALQLFILPHAIVTVSVMTALLPDLAAAWARRDVEGFRERAVRGLRFVAIVLVPAAVGLALLARPLIALAFEHGEASGEGRLAADLLALLALGLPGFSCYLYLMRLYQAMADTRSMFGLYLVENAINVVLAVALVGPLGVRGLGIAYAAAYTIGALVAGWHLRQRTGGLGGRHLAATLARVAGASAAMAVAVVAIAALPWATGPAGSALRTGAAVVTGVSVYVVVARLLGVEELSNLANLRRRRT